jgi:hypothetical protein
MVFIMESDNWLKLNYIIQYQELLDALEAFDKEFPDETPGHNALVKLAAKIRKRALCVCVDDYVLDPLPEMK